MKEFFIAENNEPKGPFSLAELKEMGISKSTLIWIEGYENWVEAETIEDLKPLFKKNPPPLLQNAKELREEHKTINVNVAFGKKLSFNKINKERELLIEKWKVKTAKEIKVAFKILKWGLVLAILFYAINSLIIKGGFGALKYKSELKNCDSNCKDVHYDIISLGKKNNTLVTYNVSYPTTQTEKNMTEGVYWKPDLINYYSSQYNLEPESIIEYQHKTSVAVEYWYTYLEIARFDITIDKTIDNAFGETTFEEAILFYLIVTFLAIVARYIFFASIKSMQWIDKHSKK